LIASLLVNGGDGASGGDGFNRFRIKVFGLDSVNIEMNAALLSFRLLKRGGSEGVDDISVVQNQ
jgi:hypothetical protein